MCCFKFVISVSQVSSGFSSKCIISSARPTRYHLKVYHPSKFIISSPERRLLDWVASLREERDPAISKLSQACISGASEHHYRLSNDGIRRPMPLPMLLSGAVSVFAEHAVDNVMKAADLHMLLKKLSLDLDVDYASSVLKKYLSFAARAAVAARLRLGAPFAPGVQVVDKAHVLAKLHERARHLRIQVVRVRLAAAVATSRPKPSGAVI